MSNAITAQTELCGIILHPAGHTRSPAMHNAAFTALDIDAVYLAFDVPPGELENAVAGFRAMGLRQLAVSIPHKEAIVDLVDELDETAREIGAVNTVTLQNGRLVGSNTDWLGAVRALERVRALAGSRAVVLGAGGTARAVVYGLRRCDVAVTVLNRTPDRARRIADELGAAGSGSLADLEKTPHDVLVNTTSVGLRSDLSPIEAAWIHPNAVVLDAVYDPPQTRLLRDAESRGANAVGGKWMLVHQAAEQLRLWTDREPPIDVMAEAFDRTD